MWRDLLRRPRPRAAVLLPAASLILIAGAFLIHGGRTRGPLTLADFRELLEKSDDRSLGQARRFAAAHVSEVLAELRWLSNYRDPQVRANAAVIAGDLQHEDALAALLPRACDSSAQVRSAAFGALSRYHPMSKWPPQRNTDVDERERVLLDWVAAFESGSTVRLTERWCEVFAGTAHVEFGRVLSGHCVRCHAGERASFDTAASCEQCHQQIYAAWSRSRHADSLARLRLATVDPVSRQTMWLDFGELRGIGCTACHRAAGTADAGVQACRYQFVGPAAERCSACHQSTWDEWQAWRAEPRLKRLSWPPGELDASGDTRSCVDCHMAAAGGVGTMHGPRQPLRERDLRAALEVRVGVSSEHDAEAGVHLSLTNLAGHALPTGTCRRALEVYAGAAGSAGLERVAFLARPCPGETGAGMQPPLAPGEQRIIPLTVAPESDGIAYRILLVEERSASDSEQSELAGVQPLHAWGISAR